MSRLTLKIYPKERIYHQEKPIPAVRVADQDIEDRHPKGTQEARRQKRKAVQVLCARLGG